MRLLFDPHTGRLLTPEHVPAYMRHPSNAGRVVRLVAVGADSPDVFPAMKETPA